MEKLTPNQLKLLRFIEDFIEWNGYSPTMEEIAASLGMSKPGVQQYLQALEKKRVITRRRYAHRSIEVISSAREAKASELPLVGLIAAGRPLEAVEVRELVDITELLGMRAGKPLYLLRVKGDSMAEEGILDGDYVVVEKRDTAQNGETVVALLPDGTATLKKFYREKGRIRLQPANPNLKPIYVDEVVIQGAVRGVFRLVR